MGARGDAIVQFDWCVGEILNALDRLKLAENTLVILTSDNGPVVDDGYRDEAVERLGDHRPADGWRGGKYSNFEGGTRVPFLVRWPGRVKSGVSKALVCQVDLLASMAALTGQALADADGPDSFNELPALLGESPDGRDHLIEHAGVLSLRQGQWKYIEPGRGAKKNQNTNTELGNDPAGQLYDVVADPGETRDLAGEQRDVVERLSATLKRLRENGRSRTVN
jgi:arylsulfatase A-like enzyme